MPKLGSGSLLSALRERYPLNEYALLEEVGNATGFRTQRHADAVAMGLWPSRGMEILGFEIKVDRRDWIRELKQPEKADVVAGYCDRWWIVATPDVVVPAELPPTWGLLEFAGKGLRIVKDAPKLEAKAPDRGFIAAMLRRAAEQSPGRRAIDEAVAVAKRETEERRGKAEDALIEAATRSVQRELDTLKKSVADFEEAAGVRIVDRWSSDVTKNTGARFGRLMRLLAEAEGGVSGIRSQRSALERALASIDELLGELNKAPVAELEEA